MEVRGDAFSFDAPDSWESVPVQGMHVVCGPPSHLGFRPTLTLSESRLDIVRDDSLAAISQSNLRSLPQRLAGACTVQVQVIADEYAHLGERRRLWSLAPTIVERFALGLVITQDIMVAGDSVAELVHTSPVASWRPDSDGHRALSTLRPLTHRIPPTTVANTPSAVLDRLATVRDSKPREDLTVQGTQPPKLPSQTYTLSTGAMSELQALTSAGHFGKRAQGLTARHELIQHGLLHEDGRPTLTGDTALDLINHGHTWSVQAVGQHGIKVQGWVTEGVSLVYLASSNAQTADSPGLLGYTATDDLARVLLAWSGVMPRWQPAVPEHTAPEFILQTPGEHTISWNSQLGPESLTPHPLFTSASSLPLWMQIATMMTPVTSGEVYEQLSNQF